MRQQDKVSVLLLFLIFPIYLSGNEPPAINHQLSLIYGIYGFREVNDAYIYNGVKSPGVFGARYTLQLDEKIWLGAEFAFDNAKPILKDNKVVDTLYINSMFLTGRLSYTLFRREKFRLYIAGAFGLKQIDKNVIGSKNNYTELSKELTLIGLQYELLPRTLIMAELTN